MPRGNGTGPMGAGPRTGRAAGYCAGVGAPGFASAGRGGGFFGRGGGMGGGGRGWRNWFHATGFPRWMRGGAAQPKDVLTQQVESLEASLAEAKRRLADLEKQP